MARPKKSSRDSKQPSIFASLGKKLSATSKEAPSPTNVETDAVADLGTEPGDKANTVGPKTRAKRTANVVDNNSEVPNKRKASKRGVNAKPLPQKEEEPVTEDDGKRTRPKRRAAVMRKPITEIEAIDLDDEDDDFVASNVEEEEVEEDEVVEEEISEDDPSDIEAEDIAPVKISKTSKGKTALKSAKVAKKGKKAPKAPKAPKVKAEKEDIVAQHVGRHLSDDPYENSALNTVRNPFYEFYDVVNSNSKKISNNLKDKLGHFFGFHQGRLTGMLNLQENLKYNILHLSVKQMIETPLNEIKNEFEFKNDVLLNMTFNEFDANLPLRNNVTIQFNLEQKDNVLVPGAVTYLPTLSADNPRHGFVLNAGALPVDMAWNIQTNEANEANPKFQYLAISIADTFNITDPRFSAFHTGKNLTGVNGLQVYQINTETFEMILVRSYISENGVISNLKWVPADIKVPNVIGVLGAVFSDGKIRFLKVEAKNEVQFCTIVTASKTIEVPETRITCFDFIFNESIVFGTQNGFIGEYDVKSDLVSYLIPLMTHGITSITSNFPDYYHDTDPVYDNGEYQAKSKVVFIGSTDLQLFVDLNDMVNQTTESLKCKTLVSHCSYIPLMNLFAVNDGSRTTKVFTQKDCQLMINILKNEGTSSSLATSRLHPMVMAGSTDGEIFMADSIKRLIANRKSPFNLYFPMARILKLEYSSSKDCYRLVTNHITESVGLKEVDINFTFNSPNVCINSMAWNENKRSGNWYAASSTGGLIFIERLASVTAVSCYNGKDEIAEKARPESSDISMIDSSNLV